MTQDMGAFYYQASHLGPTTNPSSSPPSQDTTALDHASGYTTSDINRNRLIDCATIIYELKEELQHLLEVFLAVFLAETNSTHAAPLISSDFDQYCGWETGGSGL